MTKLLLPFLGFLINYINPLLQKIAWFKNSTVAGLASHIHQEARKWEIKGKLKLPYKPAYLGRFKCLVVLRHQCL